MLLPKLIRRIKVTLIPKSTNTTSSKSLLTETNNDKFTSLIK